MRVLDPSLEAALRSLFSLCVLLVLSSSFFGCNPKTEPPTKAEVTALRKRVGQMERRIDALEKRPNKARAPGNKSKAGKTPAGKTGNKNTPSGKPTAKPSGKSTGKAPGGKSPGKAPGGKAGAGQKAPGKAD